MGKRNDVYSTPGGIQEYFLHFLYYANRGNYFSKKTLNEDTRLNEWFVPKFGPIKFRIFIGMLFLPYTGMCVSFVILGGLLPHHVNMERLFVISIIYYTPFLLMICVLESFFLFAYNFEIFNGFFHKDYWFSISWGMLPFAAGFVIQTNSITDASLLFSFIPFILSYMEIRLSRPYKIYKRK